MRVDKCRHTLVGTQVHLVRPSTQAAYVFDTLKKKMMEKKNDYDSINNTRFTAR